MKTEPKSEMQNEWLVTLWLFQKETRQAKFRLPMSNTTQLNRRQIQLRSGITTWREQVHFMSPAFHINFITHPDCVTAPLPLRDGWNRFCCTGRILSPLLRHFFTRWWKVQYKQKANCVWGIEIILYIKSTASYSKTLWVSFFLCKKTKL